MSYPSRSLTCFNLLLVLSLLLNLAPPRQTASAEGDSPDAETRAAALDSPLPSLTTSAAQAVQLYLQVEPQTAEPGDVVEYTLVLTNTGNAGLTGVVVNAVFVPGLVHVPTDDGRGLEGEYDPGGYTLRYDLAQLGAGEQATLRFSAQLADDASGDLPCTVFLNGNYASLNEDYVGADDPTQAPNATATVQVGGLAEDAGSGTGEGLNAGWQLLYNPPVVSSFSGAASYNYPLELPPGRNGLQPAVNLNYSSRAVDGTTWWVDSDWVGMGWSIDSIDIARKEVKLCWDDNPDWICLSDDFMLTLNGASYALTPASGVSFAGRYYAENAPGLRVELHASGAANFMGQYWTVDTPDGTRYRLGYNTDSEQLLFRVYDSHYRVYRWRVDEVRDVFDNSMAYDYVEFKTYDRDYASYLTNIWYNNYAGGWASRVLFLSSNTGSTPGQHLPIFRTRKRLDSVQVWDWRLGQTLREYTFSYEPEYHNGATERTLTSITQYGVGGSSSGQSLPATTFAYLDFDNKKWELSDGHEHCNMDGSTKPGHESWATGSRYTMIITPRACCTASLAPTPTCRAPALTPPAARGSACWGPTR